MALSIWNGMLIDRLHITVGIHSQEYYSFLWGLLLDSKVLKAEMAPHAKKITISKGEYYTRLGYYPSAEKIADIEIGTTKSKHRYFRLGLYPSKFQGEQFTQFQEMMDLLFEAYSYKNLYATGRVSYVEFAADTRSHKAHSFIPFGSYFKQSGIYHEATGTLGTTYLGSKSSSLRYRIYDKNKQLEAYNKPTKHSCHTRVEAVCRKLGVTIANLPNINNPFARLEIADLATAQQASSDFEWQQFLMQCLQLGCPAALAAYPNKRKEFKERLRQCAPFWWTPAWHWKDIHRALAVLAPT